MAAKGSSIDGLVALWSLLDGIWGILKGSLGVLVVRRVATRRSNLTEAQNLHGSRSDSAHGQDQGWFNISK